MKTILYISDVNGAEPIFHSQVLPHIAALQKENKILLMGLSRGEDYEYDYNYKSIPLDYSNTIGTLNYKRQSKEVESFLDHNSFDLIYSRGFRGGIVGALIKKKYFKNKVKLINDVRADVLDEHRESWIKKRIFRNTIKFVFSCTDILFFVSTPLREKYIKLFKFKAKSQVCPTFVPDNKFDFSMEQRVEQRKRLNYGEGDIVLFYSGNMAKWQNVDLILSAFQNSTNKMLYLLILTRDENMKGLIEKNSKRSKIKCFSVGYEEIQKFYFAGDYGVLIRDNTDTNKCSSPTKFSEYVNSGLALIINEIESDYILDFKNLNLKGVLLNSKEELTTCFNNLTIENVKRNKIKINTLSTIIANQKKTLN